MTPEDETAIHLFASKIYAILFGIASVMFGWLFRTVLSTRDEVVKLKIDARASGEKMADLKTELDKNAEEVRKSHARLEASQIGTEEIRKVVKTELLEHAKLLKLETKELVRETVREAVPQVMREMKGDSGSFRGPKHTPRPHGDD